MLSRWWMRRIASANSGAVTITAAVELLAVAAGLAGSRRPREPPTAS